MQSIQCTIYVSIYLPTVRQHYVVTPQVTGAGSIYPSLMFHSHILRPASTPRRLAAVVWLRAMTTKPTNTVAASNPCFRFLISMQRRMVWHAGFEQSAEASEIEKQIQKLSNRRTSCQCNVGAAEIQQLVTKLKREYENLTGEPFDDTKLRVEPNDTSAT